MILMKQDDRLKRELEIYGVGDKVLYAHARGRMFPPIISERWIEMMIVPTSDAQREGYAEVQARIDISFGFWKLRYLNAIIDYCITMTVRSFARGDVPNGEFEFS